MTDDLADRLRRAVAGAGSTWAAQPSRLRRALVDELGPDGHRYRSQLHLLVVAADENIPIRLRRTGWSPEARDELAASLMAARGWTEAAATWAVTTWASALDLIDPTTERAERAETRPSHQGVTNMATEVVAANDPATALVTDIAEPTSSATDSVSSAAEVAP